MSPANKKLIGRNIKSLREATGLSQHDFAICVDLSKRSVANIEAGEANYGIDLLYKILSFFNIELKDISTEEILPPENFREVVLNFHRNNKSPALKILEKPPTIVYGIKYHLVKSDFITIERTISEIKEYFVKLGWYYESSSISNALQRMPETIHYRPHPTKKNTNVYSKKNPAKKV
ncbi:helix-turn-helix transcriptional regulator [Desertivirga brevis]|uniref:helix-turn-helix transcriptional regulator n=1 Tax=Desertivirga brevis TaxID=2810310 RepID=UPI001A9578BE|nr:helix-turn-helix transcriptional regulator [Pedobacter sp. SYSU D00873]